MVTTFTVCVLKITLEEVSVSSGRQCKGSIYITRKPRPVRSNKFGVAFFNSLLYNNNHVKMKNEKLFKTKSKHHELYLRRFKTFSLGKSFS
jgi:hypothetical protein